MVQERERGRQTCQFCREDYEFTVSDYDLAARWFQVSACCEEQYHYSIFDMFSWSRKQLQQWFIEQTGVYVRAVWVEGEDTFDWRGVLDYGLELKDISLPETNAFIERHHRHNDPIIQWKFGQAIWNGPDLIGVISVEPPRARMLPYRHIILEVTRNCVRADMECPQLVLNACSMLYGYAFRRAKEMGYWKVVTYKRQDEDGASLKAAGFTLEYTQRKAESWDRPGRPRKKLKSPPIVKERWGRIVNPCATISAIAVAAPPLNRVVSSTPPSLPL